MANTLEKQTVCMNSNLLQTLLWNKERFYYVVSNHLTNKSSRDKKSIVSGKCCRTYFCNAKKCIQSDPECENLTADTIYRRNHRLWIQGKHLMCDTMKKHVNTKKNDIQPALKKVFEWLDWEMINYPCDCLPCTILKDYLNTEKPSCIQHRCSLCLCGLEEHAKLPVPCHKDGVCQGITYCSFCFRYKPKCNYTLMFNYLKVDVSLKEFDLINFIYDSSINICNMCFVSNKRNKFTNALNSREKLLKALEPEDKPLKIRKQANVTLPEDVLLQDDNWDLEMDLSFYETKVELKKILLEMKTKKKIFEQRKTEILKSLKEKLKEIKKGNYNDKVFIEQIVMLVEKRDREKINVNLESGFVTINH
ncbi:MAG: hypothetical protein CMO44_17285 [Verrucomicrobiales bacterium]|nr:hypothetical protein [Verrucomicrobiales bacterium]